MTSGMINLSTGPVGITPAVLEALSQPAISHRSPAFRELYVQTTHDLCNAFGVKETYILTGSGTLANEVMLQEIKHRGGPGLILSNGEFGNRLIEQARRNQLDFTTCQTNEGSSFNLETIRELLAVQPARWLLFCHCETSTGIINDLEAMISLARTTATDCYVDCMSTVGTRALDLSGVAMATASSGKGLAAVPGLAIIFSNTTILPKENVPVYLDLSTYSSRAGIPFTISSNLLNALHVAIRQKLCVEQYELSRYYAGQFYTVLNQQGLVPFANADSRVFTFIKKVNNPAIILSYESDYLRQRGWCQLALFGYYEEQQLQYVNQQLGVMDLAG